MVRHELATPGLATIGILTVNFSTGTRSSCVQQNHCTSRMRSQSQLTNDKYIMIRLPIFGAFWNYLLEVYPKH